MHLRSSEQHAYDCVRLATYDFLLVVAGQGRRQVKQSRVDSMDGVRGRVHVPSRVGVGLGYNLKLISTLHHDSIPETPSGKKVGWTCPPQSTPWQRPCTMVALVSGLTIIEL